MATTIEAPVTEPRTFGGGGVRWRGVAQAFGARRRAATASRCAPRPARSSPSSGPSGCGKSTLLELVCGLQAPDAGHGRRAAGRADAPARPAAAVAERARQRRAGAARRAAPARGAARARARPLFAALRPRGLRARAAARALAAACASASPSLRTLLAGRAGAVPRRAVRRAGRADARADAGVAGRALRREPRTVLLVTHDVEEAVAPRRPRRRALAAARPGRRRPRGRPAAPAPRAPTPRSSRCASARWRRWRRCADAAPLLVLAALLGGWELLRRRSAGSTPLLLPAPTRDRARRCGTTAPLLWPNLTVTAEEVRLGLAVALVARRRCSPSRMHFSPALRRALYPLLVGSQAMPDPDRRAAARRLVRLRPGAEAR